MLWDYFHSWLSYETCGFPENCTLTLNFTCKLRKQYHFLVWRKLYGMHTTVSTAWARTCSVYSASGWAISRNWKICMQALLRYLFPPQLAGSISISHIQKCAACEIKKKKSTCVYRAMVEPSHPYAMSTPASRYLLETWLVTRRPWKAYVWCKVIRLRVCLGSQ